MSVDLSPQTVHSSLGFSDGHVDTSRRHGVSLLQEEDLHSPYVNPFPDLYVVLVQCNAKAG